MESLKFSLRSLKSRLAGAVFGVVSSLALFAAVVVLFASASGELDPVVARLKPASPASEALGKLASRSPRG